MIPPPLLLPMERIPRHNPPPHRLRIPRLPLLRPRDPRILLRQNLHPRQRRRRPHIDPPPNLPRQRLMQSITGTILGQHVQKPQRHASRQTLRGTRADRRRQLQETEIGHLVRAGAHADELDLGDEEAVAAAVVAHAALQVGQPGEVEDFFLPDLVPHAGVPAVVGFDQADDAAARVAGKGLLDVVLVVGDEVRAVGFVRLLGEHRDVVGAAQADFERVVHFRAVVVAAEVGEGGFRGGLEA